MVATPSPIWPSPIWQSWVRHAPWLLAAVTVLAFSYLWTAPPLYARPGSCGWNAQPLVCLTFQFGPESWFHLENLALHVANVLVALALFLDAMPVAAALLAALWFALHPLQAEAVSLVAARPELMATFFALLTVRAWMRGAPWIAALWFLPALLCGGTAAALPLFLLLTTISTGKPIEPALPALSAMSVLSSVNTTWLALGQYTAAVIPGLLSAAPAMGRYLRLLVFPFGFSVWPSVDQSPLLQFVAWLAVGLLAGTALGAFHRLRLGFWFVSAIVLLAPVYLLLHGPEAAGDRRMYLPMLAAAAIAGRVLESTQFPALLAAGAVLLGGLTYSRGHVWQSSQAIWEEAAHESPSQARPRLELAQLAPPRRALEMLLETKAAHPDDARVASQLAATYVELNLLGDAVVEYGRALSLAPGNADLHLRRGQALAALQLTDAALTDFEEALALNPCYGAARAALNLPPLAACDSK
jgi:tetratricopeptide (TPR) repeat protein